MQLVLYDQAYIDWFTSPRCCRMNNPNSNLSDTNKLKLLDSLLQEITLGSMHVYISFKLWGWRCLSQDSEFVYLGMINFNWRQLLMDSKITDDNFHVPYVFFLCPFPAFIWRKFMRFICVFFLELSSISGQTLMKIYHCRKKQGILGVSSTELW